MCVAIVTTKPHVLLSWGWLFFLVYLVKKKVEILLQVPSYVNNWILATKPGPATTARLRLQSLMTLWKNKLKLWEGANLSRWKTHFGLKEHTINEKPEHRREHLLCSLLLDVGQKSLQLKMAFNASAKPLLSCLLTTWPFPNLSPFPAVILQECVVCEDCSPPFPERSWDNKRCWPTRAPPCAPGFTSWLMARGRGGLKRGLMLFF